MAAIICIKESQLREVVEMPEIDLKKFKFKFMFDSENLEEYIKDLGIETLRDAAILSGCARLLKGTKYKVNGVESGTNRESVYKQIFEDGRQLAIVNDFYDNHYMILVFTNNYVDTSEKEPDFSLTNQQLDIIMGELSDKLSLYEGLPMTTLELYRSGIHKDDEMHIMKFKMRQEEIQEQSKNKYKQQLISHFEESFKFRLITFYTKLREFGLEDIMRKLDEFGYLDERFRGNDVFIYEEEARRILARRLCAMSFKNDIEILMNQGIIDRNRITYKI